MKSQFILFKRSGVFYSEDTVTGKQTSLRTKIKAEALVILNAKNESARQPNLNLQLARTYLSASDPEATQRTWQGVMDEMESHGKPATKTRCACAMRSKAFDSIRALTLIQTKAEQIRAILEDCTVSTAHYLKRLHNLAYGLGWLPSPVLPPKQWPKLQFKAKRGITAEEHERIVAAEKNVERKFYYKLLWEIGASQSDAAALAAANVDWKKQSLRYNRMKTGTAAQVAIGKNLRDLAKATPLFRSAFPENFRQQRQCMRVRVFPPLPAARNPGCKPSLVSLRATIAKYYIKRSRQPQTHPNFETLLALLDKNAAETRSTEAEIRDAREAVELLKKADPECFELLFSRRWQRVETRRGLVRPCPR